MAPSRTHQHHLHLDHRRIHLGRLRVGRVEGRLGRDDSRGDGRGDGGGNDGDQQSAWIGEEREREGNESGDAVGGRGSR